MKTPNKRFHVIPLALTWVSFPIMMLQAVEIIAHRGASYDAPENTVASIKLAWEQKADAVEFDLHLTGDGKIIAIHDKTTDRTTGFSGNVAEMTLDELRKLDAGSWKDPSYAGEKLPLLEELIAPTPENGRLVIELKDGPEIVDPVKKILDESGKKPNQIVLISFNYETIKAAKKAMPEYEALWILSYKPDKQTGKLPYELEDMIRMCKEANLDGLDLSYKWPIDKAFVKKVHDAGLKLFTWTVDDADVAKAEVEAGVDGITTNRPGWLREQLNAQ